MKWRWLILPVISMRDQSMRIWLAYFEYCLSMCLKMISKWNYLITHIFPLWAQHQLIHFLCTLNWNETNFIIEIRVKIIPNFHLDYFNCHNTVHVSIHEKVLNNVFISLVFFFILCLINKSINISFTSGFSKKFKQIKNSFF